MTHNPVVAGRMRPVIFLYIIQQNKLHFIYVEEYSKVRRVLDVSEEHIASIIRVKERAQQGTSRSRLEAETICFSKRRPLSEVHSVKSKQATHFIFTAMRLYGVMTRYMISRLKASLNKYLKIIIKKEILEEHSVYICGTEV
jgi:hypothetical protein